MTHPLGAVLDKAPGPVLVVVAEPDLRDRLPAGFATPGPGDQPADQPAGQPADGVVDLADVLASGAEVPRGWRSVFLIARDRAGLRRCAAAIPPFGQCRTVGVWLVEGTAPWTFQPRPEWPALVSVNARRLSQGVLCLVRFESALPAHRVLVEAARQACAGGPGERTQDGVLLDYLGRLPAPGLDPGARVVRSAAEAADAERDVPPDLVITGATGPAGPDDPPVHHVIDRAPVVVADPGPDPVDERVFNPDGWQKAWTAGVVPLEELCPPGAPPGARVSESVVLRARDHQAVRLDLADAPTADPGLLQDLLRLAMSGVPLQLAGDGRHDVLARLADPVRSALGTAGVPDEQAADPLLREQHALTVRRAVFDHHSTLAWRTRLGRTAGLTPSGATGGPGLPPVTVLLATKRPHMLGSALGQLGRQTGADLEVVVAGHGFEVDPAQATRQLAAAAPDGVPPSVEVLSLPEDAFFGDVLAAAARRASTGLLLKVDDDDWYSPHAVHDLLMARRFSGADVVGMPSEFVRLEEPDLTVRRNHPSELHRRFVAGGTLLLGRDLLADLGGFRRVRRFVDSQLLTAVDRAGGRIYRTHGLGYVLRRTSGGHTWERDPHEFRHPDIVDEEWPGFRPPPEIAAVETG